MKTQASYERKLKRLGELGKRVDEKYTQIKYNLNFQEEKIKEIGENKARISIIRLKYLTSIKLNFSVIKVIHSKEQEMKQKKEKFAPILKHEPEIIQLAKNDKLKKK